jgi:hypothetical protein
VTDFDTRPVRGKRVSPQRQKTTIILLPGPNAARQGVCPQGTAKRFLNFNDLGSVMLRRGAKKANS